MLGKKWLLIANPSAGGGKMSRQQTFIEQSLQSLTIPYHIRLTTQQGDAIAFAQAGIEEGYRRILAIGGDGTGNEVINGIFNQSFAPPSEILYSLLPVGTGNDWARNHHLPKQIPVFLENLRREAMVYQDVGVVHYTQNVGNQWITQKRFFSNAGGAGYDAAVVDAVEHTPRILSKKFSYFWYILKCLSDYQPPLLRVELDDEVITDYFYSVNFGIHKYSGAGMQLTPHAVPNDGLLAVTLIRKMSAYQVLWHTPTLYSGKVHTLRQATLHQVRRLRITLLEGKVNVETDGEFLGCAPIEINILPNALKIIDSPQIKAL